VYLRKARRVGLIGYLTEISGFEDLRV